MRRRRIRIRRINKKKMMKKQKKHNKTRENRSVIFWVCCPVVLTFVDLFFYCVLALCSWETQTFWIGCVFVSFLSFFFPERQSIPFSPQKNPHLGTCSYPIFFCLWLSLLLLLFLWLLLPLYLFLWALFFNVFSWLFSSASLLLFILIAIHSLFLLTSLVVLVLMVFLLTKLLLFFFFPFFLHVLFISHVVLHLWVYFWGFVVSCFGFLFLHVVLCFCLLVAVFVWSCSCCFAFSIAFATSLFRISFQNSPDRGQSRKIRFSKLPGSGLKKI